MKKLLTLLLAVVMMMAIGISTTACGKKDVLKVIDIPLTEETYAYAVNKGNTALLNAANAYLQQITDNGEFDKIIKKYQDEKVDEYVASELGTYDSGKDQLVVLTNTPFEPFEFQNAEGKYCGIDMEVAKGMAAYMNKELCIIEWVDFDTIINQASNYNNAIVMAGLSITEERKATVDFTTEYYTASQLIITKADDTTFDNCKTKEDVENVLKSLTGKSAGYQNGNTGADYVAGFSNLTPAGYKTAALAAQAVVNGSINFVVTDGSPAKAIVKSINALN